MKIKLSAFLALLVCSGNVFAQGWTPPTGIPAPPFGIVQQRPGAPSAWPGAPASNFYYVDNSHPSATDSSNEFGYPNRPRATIPTTLNAGAYVEVRGSSYPLSSSVNYTFNGTAANPVLVVGVGSPRPRFNGNESQITLRGNYFIVDGLHFRNIRIRFGESSRTNVTHGVIRNCEVEGWTGGATSIIGFNAGVGSGTEQVVIYNNYIHDNGNLTSAEESDVHGFHVSSNTLAHHVWYIDNRSSRNSGDSVQVGTATPDDPSRVAHHIYIGRNNMSSDRENAVDIKASHDVIVSENTAFDYTPTDSSGGVGMVVHDDPVGVWFIKNRIHSAIRGIVSTGADSVYVVGNILYNIKHDPNSSYSASSLSDAAVRFYATSNFVAVGNTIWNSDAGIVNSSGSDSAVIVNNLIGPLTQPSYHIAFSSGSTAAASTVSNNLVVEPIRLRLADGLLATLAGCANCRSASASAVGLVDPNSGNFDVANGTAAVVDRGIQHAVYSLFESRYGLSIRPAFTGAAPDIGAKEWGVGTPTPPLTAPAAPSNVRIIR